MRYLILICIFYLIPIQKILGQNYIKGKVHSNQAKPISNVSVIVYSQEKAIIGFSYTDSLGYFLLKTSFPLDSLILQFTHLSYETQSLLVKNERDIEVVLNERYNQLPELVINAKPIDKRGDTLIFDIAFYKKPEDNTIEQVLRRIPGVEIKSNGKIVYDGLDISNFFIEGLDLVQGSYTAITRNLNVNTISQIEIIEKYQHIKALDSLVTPPNAAINLKLKSNIAMSIAMKGGLGFSPLLYLMDGNIFGFQKKQQFAILGGLNNIGIQKKNDFFDHFALINFNKRILNVHRALEPFTLDTRAYITNEERGIGAFTVKKIHSNTLLKGKISLFKDNLEKSSILETTLKDNKNEIIFNQKILNSDLPSLLESNLNFEINSKKLYVKSIFNTELSNKNNIAFSEINTISVQEVLKTYNTHLTTQNKIILRIKSKAYSLNSDWKYLKNQENMQITPSNFIINESTIFEFIKSNQVLDKSVLSVHTYSTLFQSTKNKKYDFNATFGHFADYIILKSELQGQKDKTSESQSLGVDFMNNLKQFNNDLYLNTEIQRNLKNDINVKFTSNFGYKYSKFNDAFEFSTHNETVQNIVYLNRLQIQKAVNNKRWSLEYNMERKILDVDNYFNGFILSSYQNLQKRTLNIGLIQMQNLAFTKNVINFEKNFTGTFTFKLTNFSRNQLESRLFNTQGVLYTLENGKFNGNSLNSSFKITKPISNFINISVDNTASYHFNDIFINNQKQKVSIFNYQTNAKFSFSFAKGTFIINPNYLYSQNHLLGIQSQLLQNFDFYYRFTKLSSLKMDFMVDILKFRNNKLKNTYGSLSYKYKIKKQKVDLEVRCLNILNMNVYNFLNINVFDINFGSTSLRPRMIYFIVSKNL